MSVVQSAIADGIKTRFQVVGSGPPLLLFAPGGFDATIEKWSELSVYARTRPIEHLSRHFTCVLFDRRECGQSGGRLERVTWADYVAQARALLDHLQIERAHLMGGCLGCVPAGAFAVAHPQRTRRLVLFWPVGGAKYRIRAHLRFSDHIVYVQQHGLEGVVRLVRETGRTFAADPRGGPWASVIQQDQAFAEVFVHQDVERYRLLVTGMARLLFDRDTAPGLEPEDLLRLDTSTLIVPGQDEAHATSAARYLEECLPSAQYWDAPVAEQTEERSSMRLLEFLNEATAA